VRLELHAERAEPRVGQLGCELGRLGLPLAGLDEVVGRVLHAQHREVDCHTKGERREEPPDHAPAVRRRAEQRQTEQDAAAARRRTARSRRAGAGTRRAIDRAPAEAAQPEDAGVGRRRWPIAPSHRPPRWRAAVVEPALRPLERREDGRPSQAAETRAQRGQAAGAGGMAGKLSPDAGLGRMEPTVRARRSCVVRRESAGFQPGRPDRHPRTAPEDSASRVSCHGRWPISPMAS
jgi:hypothetical protein